MTRLAKHLVQQRRIRLLFFGLIVYSLVIAYIIVPVESNQPGGTINSVFDGVWWVVTTITGVGYGDTFPVSFMGRILGMSLQMIGVLAFGMLVGMVTMVMSDQANRYYYRKIFERFDALEKQLSRIEKQNAFQIGNTSATPNADSEIV